ncbi:MAG: hypothetical protein ACTHJQ_21705 [Rhizobiaceae bacterium]
MKPTTNVNGTHIGPADAIKLLSLNHTAEEAFPFLGFPSTPRSSSSAPRLEYAAIAVLVQTIARMFGGLADQGSDDGPCGAPYKSVSRIAAAARCHSDCGAACGTERGTSFHGCAARQTCGNRNCKGQFLHRCSPFNYLVHGKTSVTLTTSHRRSAAAIYPFA